MYSPVLAQVAKIMSPIGDADAGGRVVPRHWTPSVSASRLSSWKPESRVRGNKVGQRGTRCHDGVPETPLRKTRCAP